jgi:hypothetical protein
MKPTIAALFFGVIAMACASDYSKHGDNSSPETVSSFCPGRCRAEVQTESSQERVAQCAEISRSPLVIDDQEISFADEDLDVIKVLRRRQGGG